jgi:hypothetical protein
VQRTELLMQMAKFSFGVSFFVYFLLLLEYYIAKRAECMLWLYIVEPWLRFRQCRDSRSGRRISRQLVACVVPSIVPLQMNHHQTILFEGNLEAANNLNY